MWIPCGKIDSMWIPCGKIDSMWIPCGFHGDSTWNPQQPILE
jgi:hypothetical protein